MYATTVAVDLAKSVLELAVADGTWTIRERHRLTRAQFERFFDNLTADRVLLKPAARGIEVVLIPPRYVRPYIKRNKTDAADAAALLEAARCAASVASSASRSPSVRASALSKWRDYSPIPPRRFRRCCARPCAPCSGRSGCWSCASPNSNASSTSWHRSRQPARHCCRCQGVGLLTATAMVAATGGDVAHFQDARHFASWFGLTPKEHSSGNSRHLGRISKRGDRYLCILLTHGARSVLQTATVAQRCHRPLDSLRTWALAVQSRTHRNKAVCALANKLARICFATLRDAEPYNGTQTVPELRRSAYALTA